MSKRHRLFLYLFSIGALAHPVLVHADPVCASYETSEPIELADEIEEISGMALSRMNPKYFWAHTDSGGESALYVLNEKGELKGKIDIVGSLNTDWEDIAVGPCEKGSEESCIYIGDMGDNLTKRTDKKVYIVKEPRLPDVITPESIAALGDVVVWKTLHVKYPASKEASYYSNPDCESLMVSPKGEIFVVSKQSEGGRQTLYRMHRDGKRAGELEALSSYLFTSQLGNLKVLFNAVTAADYAPDGKRFIVRTYAAVYEYDLDKYPDMAECFQHPRVVVDVPGELQGESAAYMADGKSIATSAEKYHKLETLKPLMHTHLCQDTPAPADKIDADAKYKLASGLRRVLESVATRSSTTATIE